tara:strand:- start:301 stop:651 length:351 start_codon:yes stop_codon:yes gene_type:complete
MAVSDEYRAYLEDQFDEFGPIQIRRMFGGLGIYRESVMFALVARDTVFLRTDARNRPAFEERGMPAFTYQHKNNKAPVAMPYSEIPGDVLEDPSELALWARDAFDAALRAKQAKAK